MVRKGVNEKTLYQQKQNTIIELRASDDYIVCLHSYVCQ